MSKLKAGSLAVAAITALALPAVAATQTKTGEIKSTDSAKHELVLANGDTFQLGANVKVDKLKAGEKVTVSYESKDGKMIASSVRLAK